MEDDGSNDSDNMDDGELILMDDAGEDDQDAEEEEKDEAKTDEELAKLKAIQLENDKIDLDALKNEFREVDFHPDEAKPPDKYTYSAYFDNLRHTLNTFLR